MKMSCNKNEKLNRREAMKLLGIGGTSLFLGAGSTASADTKLSAPSSKKEANILIAGAGTGGMLTAARLRRAAPNAKITLISPNSVHLYQSGQVYVAAGLYSEFDNKRKTSDLLPKNVNWMKDKITAFDPDDNTVQTEKNGKVSYDYLIVALGCEYDFSMIDGLEASDIGENGIASVYLNDLSEGTSKGAIISKMWMRSIQRSAGKKKVKVLFADPDTPIKGEGASLDMLFLCNDLLKGNGPKKGQDVQQNVHFSLARPEEKLFRIPKIDTVLKKEIASAKNIDTHFEYILTAVDTKKKVATFFHKGKSEEITYDYLHITPPMRSPQVLAQSKLAVKDVKMQGWMEVDPETLQHPKYKNVFGIGDILALKTGKSGGAVREQGIVIQDNVTAQMETIPLPMKYNGYSVVPFKTRYGRIILAESDKHGLAPTFPLDPTQARWIWWEIDLHLIRRAYFDLMMRGMM